MRKPIASDNSAVDTDTDLAKEAMLLADKYRKLEDRYTALLSLNQLSSDCQDLNTFYRQVHSAIAR